MSVLSFMTQSPMQYQQSTSQSSTQLPQWYNDYTQGILQNAAQFANQGYQAYPGQRIAGATNDQQQSYGTVNGLQGYGTGVANQAIGGAESALGGPSALSAGAPAIQGSMQGGISGQMGQFMNPYLQDVVANNNMLSSRNFTENTLPALQDQFTSAGQVYGGSRQGEYAERMARDLDLNQQISGAQTLAQGFNTAGQLAGQQESLGIQGGAQLGSLANQAQNTGLYGAGVIGNLGATGQTLGLNQAGAQNQMGLQQQQLNQSNMNTGYNDFLQQQYWPLTASSAMQGALQGIQVPQGTTNYNYAPYTPANSAIQNAGSTYGGLQSLFGQGGALSGLFGSGSGGGLGGWLSGLFGGGGGATDTGSQFLMDG